MDIIYRLRSDIDFCFFSISCEYYRNSKVAFHVTNEKGLKYGRQTLIYIFIILSWTVRVNFLCKIFTFLPIKVSKLANVTVSSSSHSHKKYYCVKYARIRIFLDPCFSIKEQICRFCPYTG